MWKSQSRLGRPGARRHDRRMILRFLAVSLALLLAHPLRAPAQDLSGHGGPVRALAVHEGDLYAGGTFVQAGTHALYRLARWDGAAWRPVPEASPPGGLDGAVYALASFGGSIGQFVALPYTHVLISEIGWVTALLVLGATSLLAVPLAMGLGPRVAPAEPASSGRGEPSASRRAAGERPGGRRSDHHHHRGIEIMRRLLIASLALTALAAGAAQAAVVVVVGAVALPDPCRECTMTAPHRWN